MGEQPDKGPARDPREEAVANAGQPAGLESDGRDESLTRGDHVHPSGSGPGGHTTPPGTSLPDEPEAPAE